MKEKRKYQDSKRMIVMFYYIDYYSLVFEHSYRKTCTLLLPNYVIFFRNLCARTLKVSDLDRLEADIIIILCKLERIILLAFFNVMVHLAIHLPYETKLTGPVFYSWMYLIERSLHTLKQYVRNKARPEGSIQKRMS